MARVAMRWRSSVRSAGAAGGGDRTGLAGGRGRGRGGRGGPELDVGGADVRLTRTEDKEGEDHAGAAATQNDKL